MTLRSQIIEHLKDHSPILGVELQKREFPTSKKGCFSPGSIDRIARGLAEEGRIKKTHHEGLVTYHHELPKQTLF